MPLPYPLLKQIQSVFDECGPFDSDRALQAVFVDDRLEPWRGMLPQAPNKKARITFAIDFLSNRYHSDGRSALLLFVEALRHQTHEEDRCHQQLQNLEEALASHLEDDAGDGSTESSRPWLMTRLVHNALQLLDRKSPEELGRLPAGSRVGVLDNTLVEVWEKGPNFTAYFIGAADPDTHMPRSTQDLALVVDVTQLTVRSAAEYLDEQGIAAHLVLFTNRPSYDRVEFLDEGDVAQWEEPIRLFSAVRGKSQRNLGSRRTHVFLALPVVIAFGLGAVWGTVDAVQAYHWKRDGAGYMPVDVSAHLRGV